MSSKESFSAATSTALASDEYGNGLHDDALDFIRSQQGMVDATLYRDPRYAKRLRRKVDLLVIPFLMLCYTMNFIDKVLLNYAQVMGLTPALKLGDNDFSNASSAFFIAVLIAAVPNIYLLQRLPVAKWLGFNLLVWGLCTACHAAVTNYAGLLAVRIFCGIFESAVPSALMLISSQWYTRAEQASRFSYWFCGMGLGQIIGGLLSWAFQHITKDPAAPTSGWRMMFVALGLFTILLGLLVMLFVPDAPWKAWFFSAEEKVNLLEHVRNNQTGIVTRAYQPAQVLEGLLDLQVWVSFFIMMLQGVGAGTITVYSATLLRSFGFSSQRAALLNMPSGAVNIISTLAVGLVSRYFGYRWFWCFITVLVGVAGAGLLSWTPLSNQAGSLAGIYLVNVVPATSPVEWQWVLSNTAGHTKRAFVAAVLNAGFAIGHIIGPQTFQAKDAPKYEPAKIALVACWSVSAILVAGLAAYYYLVNRRRDQRAGVAIPDEDVSDGKAFAGLTDKQNKEFRYVY